MTVVRLRIDGAVAGRSLALTATEPEVRHGVECSDVGA